MPRRPTKLQLQHLKRLADAHHWVLAKHGPPKEAWHGTYRLIRTQHHQKANPMKTTARFATNARVSLKTLGIRRLRHPRTFRT